MNRNIERYAQEGMKHLNINYDLTAMEIKQLLDISNKYTSVISAMYDIATTAFYVGYEAGYRTNKNNMRKKKEDLKNGKQEIGLYTEHK